jgi:hypothetical protein
MAKAAQIVGKANENFFDFFDLAVKILDLFNNLFD